MPDRARHLACHRPDEGSQSAAVRSASPTVNRGELVDIRLKECKRAIRKFLATAYSDERLAWLLAHARSGRLSYRSCCCLIGVATADHPLQEKSAPEQFVHSHYTLAKTFLGAREAELAFYYLGHIGRWWVTASADTQRRRRLIPMIKAEMRRREWLRAQRESDEALAASSRRSQVDVFA